MIIHRNRSLPIAIFFSFFFFFLLTLTNNFSSSHDSIDYLNSLESGTELFHPHHLVYHIVTYWLFKLLHGILPFVQNHYLIEAMSAAWGAGILVNVFRILRNRFLLDSVTAFIGTCLPAFSFGMWFYSTNIEVYMPPLFFLTLCLYLLTKTDFTRKDLILVICLHTLAILFHQVNIIFTPIVLWKIWTMRRTMRLLPSLLNYVLIGGGMVVFLYILIGWFVEGYNTPENFFSWIKGYTTEPKYWFPLSVKTLFNALVGLGHAFIGAHFMFKVKFIEDYINKNYFYHSLSDETFLVQNLSYNGALVLLVLTALIFLLMLILIGKILLNWKPIFKLQKFTIIPLLLFLVIYSCFFFFWMPENLEFWIAQSVIIWLLVAGCSKYISLPFGISNRFWLGSIAVLLFAVNYFGSIKWLGSIKNDFFHAKIQPVTSQSTTKDLILLKDGWIVKSYLKRYTTTPVKLIPKKGDDSTRQQVDAAITRSLDAGGKIFLFTEESFMHAIKNEFYIDSLLQSHKYTTRDLPNALTPVKVIEQD